jgi:hypothetical protein
MEDDTERWPYCGNTTAYISSEFYLRTSSHHSSINSILNEYKIQGYLRYVDDVLILYNNSLTQHQYIHAYLFVSTVISVTINSKLEEMSNILMQRTASTFSASHCRI